MKQNQQELAAWLAQMESLMDVPLDPSRRAELLVQFTRIAAMAEPLMAFPLDDRLEVAGVYQP
ncbi:MULTISPECIES: oxalurate catabolism protein HpxX [Erwinia]|uniref:oxalurate catabolism protein HpxX n=1 Tax=Erwinia TaxID=551 RepID=UPI0005528E42|nr:MULTISPECIES: oxalurate catabolism protein HpxX [Erwinia]